MSISGVIDRISTLQSTLQSLDDGLAGTTTGTSATSTTSATDTSDLGDSSVASALAAATGSSGAADPTAISSLLTALAGGTAGGIMGQGSTSDFASTLSSVSGSSALASLLGAGASTAATSSTAASTGGTSLGTAIVAEAKTWLGVPYKLNGESRSGIDCSGLVQTVLKSEGITVGRNVQAQAKAGVAVQGGLANAQPGDLIITKGEKHVVIYAGNGMVVHSPYPGRTVSYQKNWLTDADIETIRRVT